MTEPGVPVDGEETDPDRTAARLGLLAEAASGRLGVSARHLGTGETLGWDPTGSYRTASTVKLAIHAEILRQVRAGRVDPGRRVELRPGDPVGGSGVLAVLRPGLAPTVADLCTLMIVVSDNTATNLLIDLAGGVDGVNAGVAALGFPGIRLHRRLDYPPPPLVAGPRPETPPPTVPLGTASPAELCDLVAAVHAGTVVDAEASAELLAVLAHQHDRSGVPRAFLELAEPGTVAPAAPAVASKTGCIPGARAEVGVVTLPGGAALAYAVMADDLGDETMTALSEGDELLGQVGALLLRHWWPGPGAPPVRPGWGDVRLHG